MKVGHAVSVVVPCHDIARWSQIEQALQALGRQTLRPNKIILTVDHAPALARLARLEFTDIVIVENNGPLRGASPNRNRGASLVTTPVVAFLDDDQVPDEDWLERLMQPFADPAVVGTGGFSPPLWHDGQRPRWFPQAFGWVVGTHDSTSPTENTWVRNVWSGNMAIRLAAFQAIGGFRTGFGKVGQHSQPEDTDLCIRAAAASGQRWMFVPRAIAAHHVPARRSTRRFYLRRCFNEGKGKILMGDLNKANGDVLGEEDAFVRRTVPTVARREVAAAGAALSRVAFMGLGLGAAAAGAASAKWRLIKTERRTRAQSAPAALAPVLSQAEVPASNLVPFHSSRTSTSERSSQPAAPVDLPDSGKHVVARAHA